jgi:hypothetical protein
MKDSKESVLVKALNDELKIVLGRLQRAEESQRHLSLENEKLRGIGESFALDTDRLSKANVILINLLDSAVKNYDELETELEAEEVE